MKCFGAEHLKFPEKIARRRLKLYEKLTKISIAVKRQIARRRHKFLLDFQCLSSQICAKRAKIFGPPSQKDTKKNLYYLVTFVSLCLRGHIGLRLVHVGAIIVKMAYREQAKIVLEDFCKKGCEQIREKPDMAQVSAMLAVETMTREDWE